MENVQYKENIKPPYYVLYVFSSQRLSFKDKADPAHGGTRFSRAEPGASLTRGGKFRGNSPSPLGDTALPTSTMVAVGTGSPLGAGRWAAGGQPPGLVWVGKAGPRHLWSPTPEEHQEVAHEAIKSHSQAGQVSMGALGMLLQRERDGGRGSNAAKQVNAEQ